jgi:DNA-binding transcriptional LysR family regulator
LKPEDLRRHDCITHQFDAAPQIWSFGEGSSAVEVPVQGRFRCNSAPARIAASIAGLGIAMAPLYQIRPLVDSGQLEILMPDHEPSLTDVQIVWLPGTLPARVRLLIDFIAARLSLAGV